MTGRVGSSYSERMFTELLDRQPLVGAVRRGAERVLRSPALAVATAPHGVDRYLEQLRPSWVGDEVRARVVAVRRETPDVVTLTLRPGRGWPGAEAGQHVQVGVEVDGRRRTRSFSVASSAHRTDGCLEITVKAHADGVVSRHLVDHAERGLTVALSAPAGDFTLPAARPDRLLLVSGGSGITPVMSMLRTLVDEGHDRPVTFLHYARTEADVIFAAELEGLARDHDWLDLHVVLTGSGSVRRPRALAGRFCADHVAARVPRPRRRRGLRLRPGRHGRRRARPLGRRRRDRPAPRRALRPRPRPRPRPTRSAARCASPPPGPGSPATGSPCWSRPRRPGWPRPTAVGWACATPAPAARPAASSATSAPAPSPPTDEEPIQICVSVPVGDVAVDL